MFRVLKGYLRSTDTTSEMHTFATRVHHMVELSRQTQPPAYFPAGTGHLGPAKGAVHPAVVDLRERFSSPGVIDLRKTPLAYSVICWALAPLQFAGFAVFLAAVFGGSVSPPFDIMTPLWAFGMETVVWQYTSPVEAGRRVWEVMVDQFN